MKLEKNTIISETSKSGASILTPHEHQLIARLFRASRPAARTVSTTITKPKSPAPSPKDTLTQSDAARIAQLFGSSQLKPNLRDIALGLQGIAKRLAR